MKKEFIIGVSTIALFVLFVSFMFKVTFDRVDLVKEKYKSKVGTIFMIEGDTTTVVDYSTIMETFTLSNGKTVNSSLIFNKK